jgi:hypothetical protein
MRAQNILAVGFLSMMVASGVVSATNSFASDGQLTDVFERIGTGGSVYTHYPQSQPMPVQLGEVAVAGTTQGKVDVIERIGTGGSIYSSSQRGGDVIECAAAEGIACPYTQPTSH